MAVIAVKGVMQKVFTDKAWELLPAHKNGWKATNVPIETPKEVQKIDPPAEVGLPAKVSIEAPKKGRKLNGKTA